MLTSGWPRLDPALAAQLARCAVVQVSIDGALAATHDALAGRSGSYARAREFVCSLQEHGHPGVQLAFTVTGPNVHEVLPFVREWSACEGVNSLVVQRVVGVGRAAGACGLAPEPKAWGRVLAQLRAEREAGNAAKLRLIEDPFVQARRDIRFGYDLAEVHIGSLGEVRPHPFLDRTLGNAFQEPVLEIWRGNMGFWRQHTLAELGISEGLGRLERTFDEPSPAIGDDARPLRSSSLRTVEEGDGQTVVSFGGNAYYLNPTAIELLDHCDGRFTVREIAVAFSGEHVEVAPERARAEAAKVLGQFAAEGICSIWDDDVGC